MRYAHKLLLAQVIAMAADREALRGAVTIEAPEPLPDFDVRERPGPPNRGSRSDRDRVIRLRDPIVEVKPKSPSLRRMLKNKGRR